MKVVFADASYWIALFHARDGLHQKARETSVGLGKCRVITSEMVLSEVLNGLSDKGPEIREKVAKAVKAVIDSPNVEVVPQTSQQFRDALDRYAGRKDKEWGLTDCASMQTMEQRSIREVLTADHHFEQAGFTILLK